ncbi:MAG: hypothetical protein N6V49_13685, partial [Serratia symbiotica]|nr:hypothetical protein [Serratia symbiotica]
HDGLCISKLAGLQSIKPAFSSGANYMCAVNACLQKNQYFKRIGSHSTIAARLTLFLWSRE